MNGKSPDMRSQGLIELSTLSNGSTHLGLVMDWDALGRLLVYEDHEQIWEEHQRMETPLTHPQLLVNKHVVIFGAGGAIGQAVAKEFAAQGATVFLSCRRFAAVEQVVAAIHHNDGIAYAAEVDALDEQAVQAYLDGVAKKAGSIDILLNVMGPQAKDYGEGTSTLELPLEQFLVPLSTMLPSQFITARAAARHMVRQHSGVILFVTAVPGRGAPNSTAIGTAFGAMESLLRCLAADLGPAGVRVVGIRSGGMVDTRTIQQAFEHVAHTQGIAQAQVVDRSEQATLLGRLPRVADTARLAAFLTSDGAATITRAIVNASSGGVID
jgi:NAD(P)-dependent dehydrogenase (short-subunit alcohol dehydrogenase family)